MLLKESEENEKALSSEGEAASEKGLIYDKDKNIFLSTEERKRVIGNAPIISVPVLATGRFNKIDDVLKYLGNSNYISVDNRVNLAQEASKIGIDVDRVLRETENSMLMEGLYIKVEENGCVVDRMKYVRYSFLQTVEESQTHWLDRPIVPNKLNKNINELF